MGKYFKVLHLLKTLIYFKWKRDFGQSYEILNPMLSCSGESEWN